jgi:hypothetical protein
MITFHTNPAWRVVLKLKQFPGLGAASTNEIPDEQPVTIDLSLQ